MIKLQGLNKFFNKGKQNEIHVINNVDLTLPESGMVAIFGKSGCGKTTLLNVIGGLDKFESGTISIQDQDIRKNTDVIRNQYVGYIFQNYNLNKAESCFDNVADALRLCGMKDSAEIEERVNAALFNVGMDKYSKRTPDTLSGGQQQRIAIARAIVKNPRIILADEPTGNLDENNTVMIMNLLKAISKDHLVLLVTHEANLVDYYCDTVIELSDGKIVDIRNNEATNGYSAKDKNDIYLGELEKTQFIDDKAEIEYYGAAPETPFRLKIVNNGGKFYIRIETPKVQVLDDCSEIKLREGVYNHESDSKRSEQSFDMTKLPPVRGSDFGKLFTLKSSIKSGYNCNFRKQKKIKKVLRGCMGLFAMVIVFMSAGFGLTLSEIINAKNAYNRNTFYVYTPNGNVSALLNDAVGKMDSGIDNVSIQYGCPEGDKRAVFQMGGFETFQLVDYESKFNTNVVYLRNSMAKDLPLVEGSMENLTDYDMVITTKVADALLDSSPVDYFKEHKNLIGLLSDTFRIDDRNLRVAAIVKSDESAIYLTDMALAKMYAYSSNTYAFCAKDLGLKVRPGEAILVYQNEDEQPLTLPEVGQTIKIHGCDITVTKVVRSRDVYANWLAENGISKEMDMRHYFRQVIAAENPELNLNSNEFAEMVEHALNEKWVEYYDYYYHEFDDFIREYQFLHPEDFMAWVAVKKDAPYAKFHFMEDGNQKYGNEYYRATIYKEIYGKYPSRTELEKAANSLPPLENKLDVYYQTYDFEYYNSDRKSKGTCNYIVSEEDYIKFSKMIGETDSTALRGDLSFSDDNTGSLSGNGFAFWNAPYTVVHSNNPKLTKAWLNSEVSGLVHDVYFDELTAPAIMTPDDVYQGIIKEKTELIMVRVASMLTILAIMCICMYFIMRSSLMNRVKEVGIYRAIGVSKKNLVFKFLIEAAVLTTLTVFISYLLSSCFIYACFGFSPLVSNVLYYPVWLALAILALLYILCLFCGTLPILMLLRKTPSEILAKYDI